jgi:AcrR family transcriptional regulator
VRPVTGEPASVPRTLPRGRHRLSREIVVASQRSRLLEAMIEASAERGYPAITIADLVERAGVARRTFYEHFDNKEACFLAAYDYTAEQLITPLLDAFRPVDDAMTRAAAYVEAALTALADRPAVARMLIIEVGAGGLAAIARRLEMHRRIAGAIVELNRKTRALNVEVPPLSPTRALAIVGALIEPMHATIHDRGAQHLPELRDELAQVVALLVSQPPAG